MKDNDGRRDNDDGRGDNDNDYDMMVEVIMIMITMVGVIDSTLLSCYVVNAEARPCKQLCLRWWRTCWGRGPASPSSTAVAILLPLLAPSRIKLPF